MSFNTEYNWHPLTFWVKYVLKKHYNLTKKEPEETTFIQKLEYLIELAKSKNSNENIYSQEDIYDVELKEIFAPLDITCYDNLVLFKYTRISDLEDLGYLYKDFFDYYDGLYLECRSVVFDELTGNIAMVSMSKFKNYGEDFGPDKRWSTESLNTIYNNCFKFYITNKMDGSYQQYTYDKIRNRIIGSGSQALNPDESWRLKEGFKMLGPNHKKLLTDFSDWTFFFEFIHPNNPIVVQYDKNKKGLYLIGARNKNTGQEMDLRILQVLINNYNQDWSSPEYSISMVEYYDKENLQSILSQTDKYSSNEKEGWVVDCWTFGLPFNHLRFKIKTDDYILMHRALSKNISPNVIILSLAENKWDDLYSKIPNAYKEYADKLKQEILEYKKTISDTYNKYFNMLQNSVSDLSNKKMVMFWIQENVPKFLRGYVINCYLGKERNVLKNGGGGYYKRNELKELARRCKLV